MAKWFHRAWQSDIAYEFRTSPVAIGAALVILLWFYVSGLAMLAGAELNSVFNEEGRPPQ